MARKLFLVAGVLSLILVGMRGEAQAATTHESSHRAGVIQLFGNTLCFGQATANTQCDWRVAATKQNALATDVDVFGVNYCLGALSGQRCDFDVTAKNVTKVHHPMDIQFMGLNFCLPGSGCAAKGARSLASK